MVYIASAPIFFVKWGYSHVKTNGDVPPQGVGSHFLWKFLSYGSDFLNFPGFTLQTPETTFKIWVFLLANLQEFLCLKIPRFAYLFFEKLPLDMGVGFEPVASAAHPQPIQIWVPPESNLKFRVPQACILVWLLSNQHQECCHWKSRPMAHTIEGLHWLVDTVFQRPSTGQSEAKTTSSFDKSSIR